MRKLEAFRVTSHRIMCKTQLDHIAARCPLYWRKERRPSSAAATHGATAASAAGTLRGSSKDAIQIDLGHAQLIDPRIFCVPSGRHSLIQTPVLDRSLRMQIAQSTGPPHASLQNACLPNSPLLVVSTRAPPAVTLPGGLAVLGTADSYVAKKSRDFKFRKYGPVPLEDLFNRDRKCASFQECTGQMYGAPGTGTTCSTVYCRGVGCRND